MSLSEFKTDDAYAPMDLILLWTMRKRKTMRRSEDFLVYND
jgi:hypothetical protein